MFDHVQQIIRGVFTFIFGMNLDILNFTLRVETPITCTDISGAESYSFTALCTEKEIVYQDRSISAIMFACLRNEQAFFILGTLTRHPVRVTALCGLRENTKWRTDRCEVKGWHLLTWRRLCPCECRSVVSLWVQIGKASGCQSGQASYSFLSALRKPDNVSVAYQSCQRKVVKIKCLGGLERSSR
jgi:hypothetical protein